MARLQIAPLDILVRVNKYRPFSELSGTSCVVHMIEDDLDEPYCSYLVALEGTHLREPICFEYKGGELVGPFRQQPRQSPGS